MAVAVKYKEQFKQDFCGEYFDVTRFTFKSDFGQPCIDIAITLAGDKTRHIFWCDVTTSITADWFDILTQLLLKIKPYIVSSGVVPPKYIGVLSTSTLYVVSIGIYLELLRRNDINWKSRPSDYTSAVFKFLRKLVEQNTTNFWKYEFSRLDEVKALKDWIEMTFEDTTSSAVELDISNIAHVYNCWLDIVKPQIDVSGADSTGRTDGWRVLYKAGINESDFFLADLYSYVGYVGSDGLKIVKSEGVYLVCKKLGLLWHQTFKFKDKGKAYLEFWGRYKCPFIPAISEDGLFFWVEKCHELLVPRDIMERKGAFFTPQLWVTLAHKYIAEVFGENWQEEFYVWDNSCGTLNLLEGLWNTDKLFASTLDNADIQICHSKVDGCVTALKKENIFQFDFLNDSFVPISKGGKVPDDLYAIIKDKEKCKKLIILMNPPYAESATKSGGGTGKSVGAEGKKGIGQGTMVSKKYKYLLGQGSKELFVQFLMRIHKELQGCKIAEFSKLKALLSPNFDTFRQNFKVELLSCFLVPSFTFDNVKGNFPIGFKIWDNIGQRVFEQFEADVYDEAGSFIGKHLIAACDKNKVINKWIESWLPALDKKIGMLHFNSNDFQKQNFTDIAGSDKYALGDNNEPISIKHLNEVCMYFSVRWSVEATWVNDRDQFLYPKGSPLLDVNFVNDCLVFAMFHGQKHVSIETGDNHWIPFSEEALGVSKSFTYHTVFDYLTSRGIPEVLSSTARAVYDIAFQIFQYYHSICTSRWSEDGLREYNHNAALYDIRRYFQGVKSNGNMQVKSKDEKYQVLIVRLRAALKVLRDENIAPKVYEYGFLLK